MSEKNQTGDYRLEVMDCDKGLMIGSVKNIGDMSGCVKQHTVVEATTEGVLIKDYQKIEDASTGEKVCRPVPVDLVGIDRDDNLIPLQDRLERILFNITYDPDYMTSAECQDKVDEVAEKVTEVIDEWFNSDNSEIQSESQN